MGQIYNYLSNGTFIFFCIFLYKFFCIFYNLKIGFFLFSRQALARPLVVILRVTNGAWGKPQWPERVCPPTPGLTEWSAGSCW